MKKKNGVTREGKETDSAYFLKLVLYVILGSLWLKFSEPVQISDSFQLMGVPIGLVIGLLFASHDHFQMDRKIEYAILVVMTIVSLFLPVGIIL
jgi:hypothetical protein